MKKVLNTFFQFFISLLIEKTDLGGNIDKDLGRILAKYFERSVALYGAEI